MEKLDFNKYFDTEFKENGLEISSAFCQGNCEKTLLLWHCPK